MRNVFIKKDIQTVIILLSKKFCKLWNVTRTWLHSNIQTVKDYDNSNVQEILQTVKYNQNLVTFSHVGKINKMFHRMIKVTMLNDYDARYTLRNKKELLEKATKKKKTIIGD